MSARFAFRRCSRLAIIVVLACLALIGLTTVSTPAAHADTGSANTAQLESKRYSKANDTWALKFQGNTTMWAADDQLRKYSLKPKNLKVGTSYLVFSTSDGLIDLIQDAPLVMVNDRVDKARIGTWGGMTIKQTSHKEAKVGKLLSGSMKPTRIIPGQIYKIWYNGAGEVVKVKSSGSDY